MGRAQPGRVVAARYRLRTAIREDDMGAVWLAYDGVWHRDVVLREIPWAPPSDAEEQESRRERLRTEAVALARLDHPNIVGILDVAEEYWQPWMVLEDAPYRFPYRPLSDAVRTDGPLLPVQVAQVGLQVVAAVRQAHTVGVLHRDIKPGSILLGPGNHVLVADFGMVTADGKPALTTLETMTGSPRYMAPERANGEPATPAADLWSLGATLYAVVEGQAPFDREGTVAVLSAIMNDCPDPPWRAGPLWPVISGLLRKDPGARPDADAVEWLLQRVTGSAGPPPLAAPAATVCPVAGSVPPVAGSVPPVAGSVPPVAGSVPPVAGTVPPVAPEVAPQPQAAGAAPEAQAEDAGDAGPAEDITPGSGTRDHAPAAAASHGRRPWRQRLTTAGKER